jgi:hypothetical protein
MHEGKKRVDTAEKDSVEHKEDRNYEAQASQPEAP